MSYTFLILGAALVAFLIFLAVREFSTLRGPKIDPESHTGYKPSVKPAARNPRADFQLSLKGTGLYSSEATYMECALYRLHHQFPPDVKVKVELASADGTQRKLLVGGKSGYGSSSFSVEMSKYYVLHVTPDDDSAHWSLVVNPL